MGLHRLALRRAHLVVVPVTTDPSVRCVHSPLRCHCVCPAACTANTFAEQRDGLRVRCAACGAGFFSPAISDWCCTPLAGCEEPANAALPNPPFGVDFQACSNRKPSAASRVCRGVDASRCLQEVRCSGASAQCNSNAEIHSVVTVADASVNVLSVFATTGGLAFASAPSGVYAGIAAGGITVSTGCPSVTATGVAVQLFRMAFGAATACSDALVSRSGTWTPLPPSASTANFSLPLSTTPPGEYCVFLRVSGYQNVLEFSSSVSNVDYVMVPGARSARPSSSVARLHRLLCVCTAVVAVLSVTCLPPWFHVPFACA
jgi:hypothetical protein